MTRTQRTIGLTGIAALALVAADARAYHAPPLGRFLQRDPAGYVDGMNPYDARGSSPLVFADPNGTYIIALSG